MLHFNTRHFGDIEIADDKVITFDYGLPGFEDLRRFTVIADPDDLNDPSAVFFWLQCLDDTDIAFCIADLSNQLIGYDPAVDDEDLAALGEYDPESLHVFNLVVIPVDPQNITVNLKAPVIINNRTMKGRQVICQNEDYAIKHHLFQPKGQ